MSRQVMKNVASGLLIFSLLATPAIGADIPWNNAQLFERYSYDEDIKDVLRNVLGQNGIGVAFGPGVEGKVTQRFRRVPLQGVFNMLIAQNDLAYSYDRASNTVTVYLAGTPPPPPPARRAMKPAPRKVREVLELEHADGGKLIAAAHRLGLGAEITVDPRRKRAVIWGTPDQVRNVRTLARTHEAAARVRIIHEEELRQRKKIARETANRHVGQPSEASRTGTAPVPPATVNNPPMNVKEARLPSQPMAEARERAADTPRQPSVRQAKESPQRFPASTTGGVTDRSARSVPEAVALPVKSHLAAMPDIDLTGVYTLSGIGMVGTGSRVAVMNGQDYREGDAIDGMKIVAIESEHVRLARGAGDAATYYQVHLRDAGKLRKPMTSALVGPAVDLTAKYKLSGIGQIGKGARFAVLNGKDYRVGDTFDGMKIVGITPLIVRLEKAVAGRSYLFIVKFRVQGTN